jgi:hypothetical protein
MTQGNGSKAFDPKGFAAGSVLRPGEHGSDDKVILERGKEDRDFLPKADFYDDNQAKAFIQAINEARDFGLLELEQMDWDLVSALVAVKGKRTDRFVTLRTGVWNDRELRKQVENQKKETEQERR